MHNADIARVLQQVADLLEIQEANPFRVRAYRNAARTVDASAVPMRQLLEEGRDLTELPAVGKDIAGYIRELVETGELGKLDQLDDEVPRSLIDVMGLPGVGPKKAKKLWRELDVESVEQLEVAARAGKVAELDGFGLKSQEKVLRAIARRRPGETRHKLADAERLIAPLVEELRGLRQVQKLEVAGSFRRRRETVGDIDLLAVARKAEPVMERFTGSAAAAEVQSAGPTRGRIALRSGLEVDLRIVPRKSYGAAMLYFTGSKEHNIKLRQRAIDRGLRLSEYGLFREQAEEQGGGAEAEEHDPWAGELVAGREEKEVYKLLDLPWIPPELREDRGEIAAAERGELPRLLTLKQIRGDLQMHSTWSDGRDSIEAMVAACAERGYDYLALTDHSPSLAMTGGLDAKRVRLQWKEIAKVQKRHPEIRVLRSQEVDILADGTLDQDDDVLEELDLVVVAIHSRLQLSETEQTQRILRALEHPATNILAHPTARLINKRPPIRFDLDDVLHCAAENNVAVELNCHPHRLDLKDTQLMRARELGVKIVISTDAHKVAELDLMRYGVEQARRAWLERGDVLNTLPAGKMLEALGRG